MAEYSTNLFDQLHPILMYSVDMLRKLGKLCDVLQSKNNGRLLLSQCFGNCELPICLLLKMKPSSYEAPAQMIKLLKNVINQLQQLLKSANQQLPTLVEFSDSVSGQIAYTISLFSLVLSFLDQDVETAEVEFPQNENVCAALFEQAEKLEYNQGRTAVFDARGVPIVADVNNDQSLANLKSVLGLIYQDRETDFQRLKAAAKLNYEIPQRTELQSWEKTAWSPGSVSYGKQESPRRPEAMAWQKPTGAESNGPAAQQQDQVLHNVKQGQAPTNVGISDVVQGQHANVDQSEQSEFQLIKEKISSQDRKIELIYENQQTMLQQLQVVLTKLAERK